MLQPPWIFPYEMFIPQHGCCPIKWKTNIYIYTPTNKGDIATIFWGGFLWCMTFHHFFCQVPFQLDVQQTRPFQMFVWWTAATLGEPFQSHAVQKWRGSFACAKAHWTVSWLFLVDICLYWNADMFVWLEVWTTETPRFPTCNEPHGTYLNLVVWMMTWEPSRKIHSDVFVFAIKIIEVRCLLIANVPMIAILSCFGVGRAPLPISMSLPWELLQVFVFNLLFRLNSWDGSRWVDLVESLLEFVEHLGKPVVSKQEKPRKILWSALQFLILKDETCEDPPGFVVGQWRHMICLWIRGSFRFRRITGERPDLVPTQPGSNQNRPWIYCKPKMDAAWFESTLVSWRRLKKKNMKSIEAILAYRSHDEANIHHIHPFLWYLLIKLIKTSFGQVFRMCFLPTANTASSSTKPYEYVIAILGRMHSCNYLTIRVHVVTLGPRARMVLKTLKDETWPRI